MVWLASRLKLDNTEFNELSKQHNPIRFCFKETFLCMNFHRLFEKRTIFPQTWTKQAFLISSSRQQFNTKMPSKGKKWILENHFQGMPKQSDLKLVDFDLPVVQDGCKQNLKTWSKSIEIKVQYARCQKAVLVCFLASVCLVCYHSCFP